jgi:hypothetical protein
MDPRTTEATKSYLRDAARHVALLQINGQLPTSYDMHNPINVLPDLVIDTTDRVAVDGAEVNSFDSDGYAEGRPLVKTIFYNGPFITCEWCNTIEFLDVLKLRTKGALPEDLGACIPPEVAKPCHKCGRADMFVLGPFDFTVLVKNRARLERERMALEHASATKIQRAMRVYEQRMYGHAGFLARRAENLMFAKAATRINSYARGRLGRRTAKTERALLVIKHAHPILMKFALRGALEKTHVFWYHRKEQLELVFDNYLVLCERMGFYPPRMIVETNIQEIARRIQERKSQLLKTIQRVWRGFVVRRMVKFYRIEVTRLRNLKWAKVLKVQRLFRGHRVRVKLPKWKLTEWKQKILGTYQDEKRDAHNEKRKSIIKSRMLFYYSKERSEERTTRFMQRIPPPKEFGTKKMKAFTESCYSDDKVNIEMDRLLSYTSKEHQVHLDGIAAQQDRLKWISQRIQAYGPRGFGLRSELPDPEKMIGSFQLGPLRESKRSQGMRKLYSSEIGSIVTDMIERATHDHKRRNLEERFADYNEDMQVQRDRAKRIAQKASLGLPLEGSLDSDSVSMTLSTNSSTKGGTLDPLGGAQKSAKSGRAASRAASRMASREPSRDNLSAPSIQRNVTNQSSHMNNDQTSPPGSTPGSRENSKRGFLSRGPSSRRGDSNRQMVPPVDVPKIPLEQELVVDELASMFGKPLILQVCSMNIILYIYTCSNTDLCKVYCPVESQISLRDCRCYESLMVVPTMFGSFRICLRRAANPQISSC